MHLQHDGKERVGVPGCEAPQHYETHFQAGQRRTLAASVASSTATPHWAADSAGASLTPSPVMPTTKPYVSRSTFTTSRLSLGSTFHGTTGGAR